MVPPLTGNIPPSSAWTSARRITATEPISQAIMAAGPPISEQARAPKSQPDPMIDPSEVRRSPKNPMSRVSPSPAEAPPSAEAPVPGETVVWLISTLPVVEFRMAGPTPPGWAVRKIS